MRRIIFLLSFIAFSSYAFSQSDFKAGYVITHTDDTLHGYIDYRIEEYNSERCVFRKETGSETKEYYPQDIKAYRLIDSKYYVARQVKINNVEKWVFLEFLVEGRANLYYLPQKLYFIENNELGLQLLENTNKIVHRDGIEYFKQGNEYISYLKIYMQDSPATLSKLESAKLEQNNLIKITSDYHTQVCPDEACIVYTKTNPRVEKYLKIYVGTNINYMELYDLRVAETHNKIYAGFATGMVLGMGVDGFSIGKSERISTSLMINYTKTSHESIKHFPGIITLESLVFSPVVNYNYPRYKIKPFLGAGLSYIQFFKNEHPLMDHYHFDNARNRIGILMNLGAKLELNNRVYLECLIQDYYTLFASGFGRDLTERQNDLNILFGLLIKISKE